MLTKGIELIGIVSPGIKVELENIIVKKFAENKGELRWCKKHISNIVGLSGVLCVAHF